ncbi:MAG: NADH-quinone oxidoreductase subunit L [Candidatus Margulisiibacteriota bacterium]
MQETLVLLSVFTPIVGAFVLPLLGAVSKGARNYFALLLIAISCLASLFLLPYVASGGALVFFVFNIDALAVFMASISSFIGLIIVLYSLDYVSHYENQNEYYFMVILFLGAMMGLVYSDNLIALFIFWEITALACWRLIGFFRSPKDVLKADKAFLITVFGAVVMLLGFVGIFGLTGTFQLSAMTGKVIPGLLVGFIMVGLLSKSATFPFHTWLPDAGVAPSPVTALLHAAVLVKIGVYVFARLFLATFHIDGFWHVFIPGLAAVSMLVSAGAAMIDTDMKRIIAYSTVSQIAFIFLGLSVGNATGAIGGLLYIMMHGLAKGGLFLSAGVIEQNMKTKDITKLGGLIRTMPVLAIAFLFCSFSVMGMPPFGGFFAKYLVILGAVQTNHIILASVYIVGAFMTILYLTRLFSMIFLGEPKGLLVKEGSFLMVFCVALLAALSLLGGIFINYPFNFMEIVVKSMPGVLR